MPIPKFRGRKTKKHCRKYMSDVIKLEMKHQRPQKQAVAIAYKSARKAKCKV